MSDDPPRTFNMPPSWHKQAADIYQEIVGLVERGEATPIRYRSDFSQTPRNRNSTMIAVVFMFGPAHGKAMFFNAPLQQQIRVPSDDIPPMFQEYRAGVPYGDPRDSMLRGTHLYRLHDVFENGVEEGAIYFHEEDCCEKDYTHSREYKQQQPREQPQYNDPAVPRVRKLRGDIW